MTFVILKSFILRKIIRIAVALRAYFESFNGVLIIVINVQLLLIVIRDIDDFIIDIAFKHLELSLTDPEFVPHEIDIVLAE